MKRIVATLRRVWPEVEIILRADSGFCREELMQWCEEQTVDYVFGLARNARLVKIIGRELHQAQQQFEVSKQASRVFTGFAYRTKKNWPRQRRVIAKAEHLDKGANPRIVVTSLSAERLAAQALHEEFYCARGEMENRIKEQQPALFADRTSTALLRSNRLRLYFSSIAYCLLQALRRRGLQGTAMAKARCGTIRLKLLKIGARIRVTARKIWISMASGRTSAEMFGEVFRNLENVALRCRARRRTNKKTRQKWS